MAKDTPNIYWRLRYNCTRRQHVTLKEYLQSSFNGSQHSRVGRLNSSTGGFRISGSSRDCTKFNLCNGRLGKFCPPYPALHFDRVTGVQLISTVQKQVLFLAPFPSHIWSSETKVVSGEVLSVRKCMKVIG